jgi:hypothetical protein
MEYNHDRAVADGVNVGYEVYRIRTRLRNRVARLRRVIILIGDRVSPGQSAGSS